MEKLLTPQGVADYLGVPVATLYQWRYLGSGPRSLKVGRHVRYDPQDVKRWLEEHAHTPRSAA